MGVKLSLVLALAALAMAGVLIGMALLAPSVLTEYAAFLSFILLLFVIGIVFAKFEEADLSSKEVALIGILAAITAASRVPFAALPNIKPCTFLIIVTGLIFGVLAGAMVGSMTALVSNFFFGQGSWTVWEMAGWAMVGMVAGYVGMKMKEEEITVTHVVMLGVVLGLAYNVLLDFSSWIMFYRADPSLFVPTFVAGIPFAVLHVVGNVVFALVLGKPVLTLFKRFKRRAHVSYAPDRAPETAGAQ